MQNKLLVLMIVIAVNFYTREIVCVDIDKELLRKNEAAYKEFVADMGKLDEEQSVEMLEKLVMHTQDEMGKWNKRVEEKIAAIQAHSREIEHLEVQNYFNLTHHFQGVNLKQQAFFILLGYLAGAILCILILKLSALFAKINQKEPKYAPV